MTPSVQDLKKIGVRLDALPDTAPPGVEARSFVFDDPVDVICVTRPDQVHNALARIEEHVAAGCHAAGYIGYEAATGLDEALCTAEPSGKIPLLWFGVFRQRRTVCALEGVEASPQAASAWLPEWTPVQHEQRVKRVRDWIAAGDTYQVNLTMQLRAAFDGDPEALYHALCLAQPTPLCAFIDTGHFAVCSASPELHFALDQGDLITRPMKGTRPRGRWATEDDGLAEELADSAKERAENTMIVDLLRNDLGRVAGAGSVRVDRLWDVERYRTVWQMTSTIRAQLRDRVTLPVLFSALFPCGSITGAPKIRTMQIIDELEDAPRGVYTGSIGYISPSKEGGTGLCDMEARFSVAIRTVTVERERRMAVAGVGGGITWDSVAASEYAECMTKARFLSGPIAEPFRLLETMRWEPEGGIWLLERHLERLETSARYFDFHFDRGAILDSILKGVTEGCTSPARVRLTLAEDGSTLVEISDLDEEVVSWSSAIAPGAVHTDDVFLYHKTTNRITYDRARQGLDHVDEPILVNERGEVTETVRGNVVVTLDGRRLTPPVESGLLPGTYREELLHQGEIEEGIVLVEDLLAATEVFSVNSVRRWVRLKLVVAEARQNIRAS